LILLDVTGEQAVILSTVAPAIDSGKKRKKMRADFCFGF